MICRIREKAIHLEDIDKQTINRIRGLSNHNHMFMNRQRWRYTPLGVCIEPQECFVTEKEETQ